MQEKDLVIAFRVLSSLMTQLYKREEKALQTRLRNSQQSSRYGDRGISAQRLWPWKLERDGALFSDQAKTFLHQ